MTIALVTQCFALGGVTVFGAYRTYTLRSTLKHVRKTADQMLETACKVQCPTCRMYTDDTTNTRVGDCCVCLEDVRQCVVGTVCGHACVCVSCMAVMKRDAIEKTKHDAAMLIRNVDAVRANHA